MLLMNIKKGKNKTFDDMEDGDTTTLENGNVGEFVNETINRRRRRRGRGLPNNCTNGTGKSSKNSNGPAVRFVIK